MRLRILVQDLRFYNENVVAVRYSAQQSPKF